MIDTTGCIHCSFIIGKSRLAPLKQLTIPRLELSAAVLAVRLNSMVVRELDAPVQESYFWTDSTCVLGYINNVDRRFKTFVTNRVSTIHEESLPSQWNYVNTNINPADCASRGQSSKELLENKKWIGGPSFLWNPNEFWPQQPIATVPLSDADPEIKKEVKPVYFTTNQNESSTPLSEILNKYSSWIKLRKVVAWILRFKANLKKSLQKTTQQKSTSSDITQSP